MLWMRVLRIDAELYKALYSARRSGRSSTAESGEVLKGAVLAINPARGRRYWFESASESCRGQGGVNVTAVNLSAAGWL